jgi:uncharacterized membrane protein YozB (DUF420 family)
MRTSFRLRLIATFVIFLSGFGIYKCLHAAVVTSHGGTHELDGLFDYPLWGLTHFIAGALFMTLLPFQLWAGFRNRHRKLHKRSGRILFGAGLVLAVSGLAFVYLMPARPVSEKIFMTIFSLLFGLFLVKAVMVARRRDFVQHREWMIRGAAIAFGPMVQRLIFPIFPVVLGIRSLPEFWEYFVTSLWLSVIIALPTGEWWLRLAPDRPALRTASNSTELTESAGHIEGLST